MLKGIKLTVEPYLIDKEIQVNIFDENNNKLAYCFVPITATDKFVGEIFAAKDRVVNRDKYEIQKLEERLRQIGARQLDLDEEAKDIKDAIADIRKTKRETVSDKSTIDVIGQRSDETGKGKKLKGDNKNIEQARQQKSKASSKPT